MAMAVLAHTASAFLARPQLPSRTPTSQFQPRCALARQWNSGAPLRRRGPRDENRGNRASVAMAALPDLHAFSVLAMDLVNLTDLQVGVELDPAREVITDRSTWKASEETIKVVYMMFSLIFCWGCCVFGSMNDVFYDSEEYRKAGGNGTGHWIYDQLEREERAARDEMWSEDLIKEIEEKAEEVRRAEEERKEKEKDLELV